MQRLDTGRKAEYAPDVDVQVDLDGRETISSLLQPVNMAEPDTACLLAGLKG